MRFTLLTPEQKLFDDEVVSAIVPGSEGYVGFLEGHVPFVTPLKPGIVEIETGKNVVLYAVSGGYFECSASGMVVLAENAYSPEQVDLQQAIDELKIAEAQLVNSGEVDETTAAILTEALQKATVRVELGHRSKEK